jgi:hypothetical protein
MEKPSIVKSGSTNRLSFFYINALGLFLGSGSGWGVWGVEVVFLIITVILSYLLLRQKFHPVASLLITVAAYLAAFQYMSGNFTEEYALGFLCSHLVYFPFSSNQNPINFAITSSLASLQAFCSILSRRILMSPSQLGCSCWWR